MNDICSFLHGNLSTLDYNKTQCDSTTISLMLLSWRLLLYATCIPANRLPLDISFKMYQAHNCHHPNSVV